MTTATVTSEITTTPRPALRRAPVRMRGPGGTQWAGVGGGAALAIVTSGAPAPASVVMALGLTAMGVVILAWLRLGRDLSRITVGRLRWIAASWCLPLLAARPLFSGDVRSYWAQGVIAARGLDPYLLGPTAALGAHSPVTEQVSPYWRDAPAPYGPAFVAVCRSIARLAGDNALTVVLLHRIVELAGLALITWALPRLARRAGVEPATAVWLGLLNPLVLWHVVAGAHNDGIMLGLVLCGMEVALAGLGTNGPAGWARVCGGAAMLTTAANVKIVAAAAVCCLGAELARRRGATTGHRAALVLGLMTGCAAFSAMISIVTGLGFGWVSALDASVEVHSWLAPTNQLGFLAGGAGALAGMDITQSAITACAQTGAAIGALVAATLWSRTYRGRLHPIRALGLVFAAMLALGPVVQPWYLLWTVLPLAATARGRTRPVLIPLSAVFAMLLPPVAGSPGTLIKGYVAAAFLLGGALLVMRSRPAAVRPPRPYVTMPLSDRVENNAKAAGPAGVTVY